MNHKVMLSMCLKLFLLLMICIVPISSGQSRRFQGRAEVLPLTRNLPAIDKVEILKFRAEGDLWRGEIETSKTLKGAEAQNLASLWRQQSYNRGMAACHNPAYGIKFFSGEKLLVYASLCWDCNNIGFTAPRINGTQSFDGRGKKGQQLLKVFRTAFPETK